MLKFIGHVANFVVSVLVSLLGGLVFKDLWSWFVVPLGVRPITVFWACGLLLIIGFAKTGLKPAITSDDDDPSAGLIAAVSNNIIFVIVYLLSWAVGYCWYQAAF